MIKYEDIIKRIANIEKKNGTMSRKRTPKIDKF